MSEFENLGNTELYECFFALKLRIYHYFRIDGLTDEDYNRDPRTDNDLLKDLFNKNDLYLEGLEKAKKSWFRSLGEIDKLPESNKHDLALYMILTDEIRRRGFSIYDEYLGYKMNRKPTYIREITPTDYLGDQAINLNNVDNYYENDFISFDYPVREACIILNKKGYVTYWSSANRDDALFREGDVVKDKHVAYILIDYANLSDELKEKLLLDGRCDFWGVALAHHDNGKYYGIWAEITSENMRCDDLSKALTEKALALPTLQVEKNVSPKI